MVKTFVSHTNITAATLTVNLGEQSQVIDRSSQSESTPRSILTAPWVDDGYVKFGLLPSLQSQGGSSTASTTSSNDSKQESSPEAVDSSDDPIYEQVPYEPILRIMPLGTRFYTQPSVNTCPT